MSVIREIRVKAILSRVNGWFGCKYNMNLYRGCQHQCIYCDSRSECYGISDKIVTRRKPHDFNHVGRIGDSS